MCPRFDSGLHHPISDQIGCMLKAIMRITDFDAAWAGTSFNQTLSLLDHVAEFVSQHPLSGLRKADAGSRDRKSTRLNSSHANISYAVFCLKKKKKHNNSLLFRKSLITPGIS